MVLNSPFGEDKQRDGNYNSNYQLLEVLLIIKFLGGGKFGSDFLKL